jgi:hypothetical protein
MDERRPLSPPAKVNAVALAATAVGMVLQITSGSDLYPTIPPGPIILLVGAGVVALGLRRWSPIIGLVVPLILTVGGIVAAASGNRFLDQLVEPAELGIFVGTVVHLLGLIAALLSGGVALMRSSRGSDGTGASTRDPADPPATRGVHGGAPRGR